MEFDVNAQLQVVARYGRNVIGSVIVATLDLSGRVADEDFLTLDATQPVLVTLFDTQVARVVTGAVVVIVLDITGVDLTDVAQHIGGNRIIVLAQDALHDIEAWESVEFFLQAPVVLWSEVVHEDLLCECRVIAALPHLLPTVVKFGTADLQRVAEVDGVKRHDILGNHHQVILGRVIHDQIAVTVIDESARRIDYLLHECIVVGMSLVGAVQQLQLHQADDVDEHNSHDKAADDKLAFLQIIIFSHGVC